LRFQAAVSASPTPDSFGAVHEGREFAMRAYAAINARDHEAIKALSAPDGAFTEEYFLPYA
jgi:hypothetical protein